MEVRSENRAARGLALAALSLVGIACADPTSTSGLQYSAVFGDAAVASVEVMLDSSSIEVGSAARATATIRDATGRLVKRRRRITWSATDASVALVSDQGNVTGLGAGTSGIVATVDGMAGQATLVVRPQQSLPEASPPVAAVTVSVSPASVAVGATAMATATLRDANGNTLGDRAVSWQSQNGAVATVNASGTITGVSAGSAAIIGTSEGVTGSATVTVTAPTTTPDSRTLLFASDWSSGLGTSSGVLTDQSKPVPWSLLGGTGLEVVPGAGLDFPSANVLRVTARTATSGFAALRRTGLPVLAIGEVRSYRWYIRVAGGIEDANIHPIQDGNAASDANWQFESLNTTGGPGKWTSQFKFGIGNYPNNNFRGPALDVDRTYRFEIQLTRTGSTAFNFHVRVYDAAGTLLYGDADFRNISPGVASLAAQGTGQFGFVNVANTDGLNAGSNGVAPLSSDRVYSHQGAFAVCRGGWCGPYVAGEQP